MNDPGRFTPRRKPVLDAIRSEFRRHNYLTVLFDFDKPTSRDNTETISTLAHMARFVIADITDARSIPQELQTIVPNLPSVPVQPLLQVQVAEYGMFEHFKSYQWVLKVHRYGDLNDLLKSLGDKVIAPAEQRRHKHSKGTTPGCYVYLLLMEAIENTKNVGYTNHIYNRPV